MIWNPHLELQGKHALFAPSSPYWMNDTEEESIQRYCSSFASSIGTILHNMAAKHIRHSITLNRYDKKHVRLDLLEAGIPFAVVDRLPVDDIFENLMLYVNDCIGFRMTPEQPLKYSDLCFGHCDAIHFNEYEKLLRISDLKTGSTPAKMEQLVDYDSLFRLEYCPILHIRPEEIKSELRIYQGGEIRLCTPEPDEIIAVMEINKTKDHTILNMQ